MEYKQFSPEQLDRAKNADLIAFLSAYMGVEFKKAGKYYQCKQHSSLVVYADRKGFVWNSQNISGGDTIDFLRKSFPDAIETIIGESAAVTYTPAPKYKAEAGQLELPEKADGKYNRVYAYLSQTRGISSDVISDFMRSKQLYQDTKGNCVFVGFDEQGTAKFGSVRGTLTERKYRGTYKGQTRLALCGSSDVALEAFLERHSEVRVLHFRLDNDEAGRAAVEKYTAKYQARGYEVHSVFSKGKDVNEDLINAQKQNPRKR